MIACMMLIFDFIHALEGPERYGFWPRLPPFGVGKVQDLNAQGLPTSSASRQQPGFYLYTLAERIPMSAARARENPGARCPRGCSSEIQNRRLVGLQPRLFAYWCLRCGPGGGTS